MCWVWHMSVWKTSQVMWWGALLLLPASYTVHCACSTSSGGGEGPAAAEEMPLPAGLEHAAKLSRRLASASLADSGAHVNGSDGGGGSGSESSCGSAVVVVDERLYASAPELTQLAAAAEAGPQRCVKSGAAGATPAAAAAAAVAAVDGPAAAAGAAVDVRDAAAAPAAAGVAAGGNGGRPPKGAKIAKQVQAANSTYSMSAFVCLSFFVFWPVPQAGSWT